MLISTGNFGPPKYSTADTIELQLEITAVLGNVTIVKMPRYEDPDNDKIQLILDFDRAILFTHYDQSGRSLILRPIEEKRTGRTDLGEYHVRIIL